jgi:hypothetical protein
MDFIGELIDEVIESVVEERWLPIVGYEGLYEVSDLGRIKSSSRKGTRGGILKQKLTKKGYFDIMLNNKSYKMLKVHRLVLEAFLPLEEKKEVDHINHIKSDNRFINLRWATSSENARHKNKKVGYSSQYKGVSWDRISWKSSCQINNKKIYLGLFDAEVDAAKAYNAYIIANNLQEFAVLNVYL